ncbi:5160_t:CDS:1, partial [Entrophospora sp. SA101]
MSLLELKALNVKFKKSSLSSLEVATPFKTLDPLTDFTNAIVDKTEDLIIY